MSPVSNAFRRPEDLDGPEVFLPLRALVCDACFLVQLQDFRAADDLFTADYPYFSSFSDSWLSHARRYAQTMTERCALGADSLVVEIASNDGYLLRWFKEQGVPVLGVDPARSVAEAAKANHGIETVVDFFGVALAKRLVEEGRRADVMAANNVLAHVPDINDFLGGFAVLLKPEGTATFEFPHLLNLIARNQFDTIYHEHYSYLSLTALDGAFARHGLEVVDVEALPTHGGSLRLYVRHVGAQAPASAVAEMRAREEVAGLRELATYAAFEEKVKATKRAFLKTLIALKEGGLSIAAYGAAAKGNTLLNYCGVGRDMIDFVCDRNPAKQGLFLPGTGIPVLGPDAVMERRPDVVVILPWNLKDEIAGQLGDIRTWGGRFLVPIPTVEMF
jgi:SAM-dependent methyltransferase